MDKKRKVDNFVKLVWISEWLQDVLYLVIYRQFVTILHTYLVSSAINTNNTFNQMCNKKAKITYSYKYRIEIK